MFQIRNRKLPKDPSFPVDLQQLGFFIAENDSLRRTDDPSIGFRYRVSDNDRVKEVHLESVCECLRANITSRLTNATASLSTFYLPQLSDEKPTDDIPHLPILCTPLEELREKSRIIVIVNDDNADLAVWSWPAVLGDPESAIAKGSALSLVLDVTARADLAAVEIPGFIILNPGQLLYSFRQAKAVTLKTWNALPRESAIHPPPNSHNNRIDRNETPADHIRFVLNYIVKSRDYVSPAARLFMIGLSTGGMNLLDVLQEFVQHDDRIMQKIGAIAMTEPYRTVSEILPDSESNDPNSRALAKLHSFLEARARVWEISSHPINTPLSNPSIATLSTRPKSSRQDLGNNNEEPSEAFYHDIQPWPTVAGGEVLDPLHVFIESYTHILDWFEEVERKDIDDEHGYSNGALDIPDFVIREAKELRDETQPSWGLYEDPISVSPKQSTGKENTLNRDESEKAETEGNKAQQT